MITSISAVMVAILLLATLQLSSCGVAHAAAPPPSPTVIQQQRATVQRSSHGGIPHIVMICASCVSCNNMHHVVDSYIGQKLTDAGINATEHAIRASYQTVIISTSRNIVLEVLEKVPEAIKPDVIFVTDVECVAKAATAAEHDSRPFYVLDLGTDSSTIPIFSPTGAHDHDHAITQKVDQIIVNNVGLFAGGISFEMSVVAAPFGALAAAESRSGSIVLLMATASRANKEFLEGFNSGVLQECPSCDLLAYYYDQWAVTTGSPEDGVEFHAWKVAAATLFYAPNADVVAVASYNRSHTDQLRALLHEAWHVNNPNGEAEQKSPPIVMCVFCPELPQAPTAENMTLGIQFTGFNPTADSSAQQWFGKRLFGGLSEGYLTIQSTECRAWPESQCFHSEKGKKVFAAVYEQMRKAGSSSTLPRGAALLTYLQNTHIPAWNITSSSYLDFFEGKGYFPPQTGAYGERIATNSIFLEDMLSVGEHGKVPDEDAEEEGTINTINDKAEHESELDHNNFHRRSCMVLFVNANPEALQHATAIARDESRGTSDLIPNNNNTIVENENRNVEKNDTSSSSEEEDNMKVLPGRTKLPVLRTPFLPFDDFSLTLAEIEKLNKTSRFPELQLFDCYNMIAMIPPNISMYPSSARRSAIRGFSVDAIGPTNYVVYGGFSDVAVTVPTSELVLVHFDHVFGSPSMVFYDLFSFGAAERPEARGFHATAAAENRLFVQGGSGKVIYKDLWVAYFEIHEEAVPSSSDPHSGQQQQPVTFTVRWQRLSVDVTGRTEHTMSIIPAVVEDSVTAGALVIVGGLEVNKVVNDIVIFNIETKQHRVVSDPLQPPKLPKSPCLVPFKNSTLMSVQEDGSVCLLNLAVMTWFCRDWNDTDVTPAVRDAASPSARQVGGASVGVTEAGLAGYHCIPARGLTHQAMYISPKVEVEDLSLDDDGTFELSQTTSSPATQSSNVSTRGETTSSADVVNVHHTLPSFYHYAEATLPCADMNFALKNNQAMSSNRLRCMQCEPGSFTTFDHCTSCEAQQSHTEARLRAMFGESAATKDGSEHIMERFSGVTIEWLDRSRSRHCHDDRQRSLSLLLTILLAISAFIAGLCVAVVFWFFFNRTPNDQNVANAPKKAPLCITFVSIADSNVHWRNAATDFHMVLNQFNSILAASIADHKGYNVKTVGEAVMVATATTDQALCIVKTLCIAMKKTRWQCTLGKTLELKIGIDYCSPTIINTEVAGYDYGGPNSLVAALLSKPLTGNSIAITDAALTTTSPEFGLRSISRRQPDVRGYRYRILSVTDLLEFDPHHLLYPGNGGTSNLGSDSGDLSIGPSNSSTATTSASGSRPLSRTQRKNSGVVAEKEDDDPVKLTHEMEQKMGQSSQSRADRHQLSYIDNQAVTSGTVSTEEYALLKNITVDIVRTMLTSLKTEQNFYTHQLLKRFAVAPDKFRPAANSGIRRGNMLSLANLNMLAGRILQTMDPVKLKKKVRKAYETSVEADEVLQPREADENPLSMSNGEGQSRSRSTVVNNMVGIELGEVPDNSQSCNGGSGYVTQEILSPNHYHQQHNNRQKSPSPLIAPMVAEFNQLAFVAPPAASSPPPQGAAGGLISPVESEPNPRLVHLVDSSGGRSGGSRPGSSSARRNSSSTNSRSSAATVSAANISGPQTMSMTTIMPATIQ